MEYKKGNKVEDENEAVILKQNHQDHEKEAEEYLILEVTNDLVFKKIVKDMQEGLINQISIPSELKAKGNRIEIGEFKFQGSFGETIGTQLIFDEGESLEKKELCVKGCTDKILLLDPLIRMS